MDSEVRRLSLSTGIAVPCLVQGDPSAQPLLLLHAWGESRRSFDRLIPLLEGLQILAPDLRGHGEADKPRGGYSLTDHARDVEAILDALDLESAAILDSSSGGTWRSHSLRDPLDEGWIRQSLKWFTFHRQVPAWFVEDRVRDGMRMPAHVWPTALEGLYQAVPPTDAGPIGVPALILWECPEQVAADTRAFLAPGRGWSGGSRTFETMTW
ncbi:alpha/beta hydrolase family protein [Arthrobacter sp. KFRI-F3372]|nr:alpha/beta hydrolase family protein [Arthrobacter sp. KFRI-F3372]